MAMLLLRGAQTVAELRARTARLHPFAAAEQVEAALERLAEGPDALVRELPRQPGQRETRWIHLAGTAEVERDLVTGFQPAGAGESRQENAPPSVAAEPAIQQRLDRLEAAVGELTAAMNELRSRLGD